MRTPEKNWRRHRGVISGPGIGLLAGLTLTLITGDAFPIGVVNGTAIAAGLAGGAVYDSVRRRRAEK